MSARAFLCTSVSLCTLACSSGPDAASGADESSSSGGGPTSGDTDGPSTSAPSTSAPSTTDDPTTTADASSSDDATTTADTSSTGDASSSGEGTGESSTTGTEDDAYGGDWCGNASTGRVDIPAYDYQRRLPFGGRHDGPQAFVGWVTEGDAIQVAIYDVAAATWAEPVTLAEGYEIYWANDAPSAAVDGDGNAIVGYVVQDPEPHAVVHRYDAASGSWSTTDLPGVFEAPETGGLTAAASGHAVFVAYDLTNGGIDSQPFAWFYDPTTDAWSESVALDEPSYAVEVDWAQDPESGDAALLLRTEADDVLALHHDAASGELTTATVDSDAYVDAVVATGSGEFLALVSTGGFQEDGEVHALRYAGGTWSAPETIGSGFEPGPVRLVTDGSGHAVASWNDSLWGTFARPFDGATGWGETITASATNAAALPSWADHRVAMDDEGYTIVWSAFASGTGIRTWAMRVEDGDAGTPVELAPGQPAYSRIANVTSLGTNRVRAVWTYVDESEYEGFGYACHTPVSGWSDAVDGGDYVLAIENRTSGEAVVLGATAGVAGAYVDYYAAL